MLDNLIVLSDGLTAVERTMMEGGERDQVLALRRSFQRMMKERYSEMIETLTGRKVPAFLSKRGPRPDRRDVPDGWPSARLRRARAPRPAVA